MESRNLVNLKTGKSNIRALRAKRTHVHDLFIMSSSRTWTLPHHSNDRVEYAPDFELTKRKSILDLSFCKLQHIYWNWEYFWVNSPCFTFCCIMLWFGTVQLNPYPSGLLHWYWGNLTIAPVPVMQPWRICEYRRHKFPKSLLILKQLERLCSEDTPAAPWLPILLIHIGSQVKTRQSYKFKEIAKTSIFLFLKKIHMTHPLKLLDKMCKYEMDPLSIMEDTEQTRFCPQTDRRTRWNQYTPLQLRWARGIITTTKQSLTKPYT